MKYNTVYNPRQTPQNKPMKPDQVQNNAGGYAWQVNDWTMLDRFLLLGTEKATYYQDEQTLTIEAAEATLRCIKENAKAVVDRVVEISHSGRASKNDPALFVLSLCASLPESIEDKTYALDHLNLVARTGTHLFTFIEYVQTYRGWGRSLRHYIGEWYLSKDINSLAYQLIKYRSRNN